jgi:hypothetical protein
VRDGFELDKMWLHFVTLKSDVGTLISHLIAIFWSTKNCNDSTIGFNFIAILLNFMRSDKEF